jgi:hypothetical protein
VPAAFGQIILAGFLGGRAGEAFFFIRFWFPELEYDSFASDCIARRNYIRKKYHGRRRLRQRMLLAAEACDRCQLKA